MENLITITEKQRDELVKQIINDAIIGERVIKAMNLLVKVSNPREDNWDAECYQNGVFKAYPLMGLPHAETYEEEQSILPLQEKLWEIFNEAVNEDYKRNEENQRRAVDLAEIIFIEWQAFLRDNQLGLRKVG